MPCKTHINSSLTPCFCVTEGFLFLLFIDCKLIINLKLSYTFTKLHLTHLVKAENCLEAH